MECDTSEYNRNTRNERMIPNRRIEFGLYLDLIGDGETEARL